LVKSTQPSFPVEAGEATGVAVIVSGFDVAVAGREVTVGMKAGISAGATGEVVGIGPGAAGAQAAMVNIRIREVRNLWDIGLYFLKCMGWKQNIHLGL
jgi:hypothetical protein